MLVALLLLSYMYICIVTINVLWPFLTVSLVGLQCVIVVFPDYTHLHFDMYLTGSVRDVQCIRPKSRHAQNAIV